MRLVKGTATLEDCVRIFHFVERLPQIAQQFQEYSGVHSEKVAQVFTAPILVRATRSHTSPCDCIRLLAALDSHVSASPTATRGGVPKVP